MQINSRLCLVACLATWLLLPGVAGATHPSRVTVHVRLKSPDTGAPLPAARVKVAYWRCVMVVACAIKPLAEGTTGADGEVSLVVEKHKSMIVQDVACPGEVTTLGVSIPADDLRRTEVTVDITARKVVCQPHQKAQATTT